MIIEKKFDSVKVEQFLKLFRDSKELQCRWNHEKFFIVTEDPELINYLELNFDDFVTENERLDAVEALIIGEQSTFSKIRSALKI